MKADSDECDVNDDKLSFSVRCVHPVHVDVIAVGNTFAPVANSNDLCG